MSLRFAYLAALRVFGWFALPAWSGRAKDAGTLIVQPSAPAASDQDGTRPGDAANGTWHDGASAAASPRPHDDDAPASARRVPPRPGAPAETGATGGTELAGAA